MFSQRVLAVVERFLFGTVRFRPVPRPVAQICLCVDYFGSKRFTQVVVLESNASISKAPTPKGLPVNSFSGTCGKVVKRIE